MKSTATKRETRTKAAAMTESAPGAGDMAGHVATAAYYKAEARGFLPGQELDDWLQAEAEASNRQET